MSRRSFAVAVLWVVALFYGYGALVHVLNLAGMTGFEWVAAPRKWQILDIVYLVVDLIVLTGLGLRMKFAVVIFYLAALSQIVLYTVLRDWITDVPEQFTVTPEQNDYLTILVGFHLSSLVMVTLALWIIRGDERRGPPSVAVRGER